MANVCRSYITLFDVKYVCDPGQYYRLYSEPLLEIYFYGDKYDTSKRAISYSVEIKLLLERQNLFLQISSFLVFISVNYDDNKDKTNNFIYI